MPLTQEEKKSSMVKLISVASFNFINAIVILQIQAYTQNSFLLLLLFIIIQEFIQGIVLPVLFIQNLPSLKNFIVDKINHSLNQTKTAILNTSKTIFDFVSGCLPRRENQIDVIA